MTGFSMTDSINLPSTWKQNVSTVFPFFGTRDLDFVSLKLIFTQEKSCTDPERSTHEGSDRGLLKCLTKELADVPHSVRCLSKHD